MEKLYVKNLETGKIVYTDEILVEYNKTTFALKGFTKYSLEVLDEINDIIKRFKAPYHVYAKKTDAFDAIYDVTHCRVLDFDETQELLSEEKPEGKYYAMVKTKNGFVHVATLSDGDWKDVID